MFRTAPVISKEKSMYQKLRSGDAIGCEVTAMSHWTTLSEYLSISSYPSLRHLMNSEEQDIHHKICDETRGVLQEEFLIRLWVEILKSSMASVASGTKQCQQLVLFKHLLTNYFGDELFTILPNDIDAHIMRTFILAVIVVISAEESSHDNTLKYKSAIASLIESFSSKTLMDLLRVLMNESLDIVDRIVKGILFPNLALHCADLLLKRVSRSRDMSTSNLGLLYLLEMLVSLVLSSFTPESFEAAYNKVDGVDRLFTRYPVPSSIMEKLVQSAPEDVCPVIVLRAGRVWGDRSAIARGNASLQESLTVAILTALNRLQPNDILVTYNNHPSPPQTIAALGDTMRSATGQAHHSSSSKTISILSVLSSGVSAYLDAGDRDARVRGMRVAKVFSGLLGAEVTFTELDEYNKNRELYSKDSGEDRIFDVSRNSSSAKASSSAALTAASEYADDDIDSNSNADSSELESLSDVDNDGAFDTEDLPTTDNNGYPVDGAQRIKTKASYLRTCLQWLQYPDSKPGAFDKQRDALLNIPPLVKRRPADSRDVCAPLVREVLRLQNSFNMQDFDSLHQAALQALLCGYPALAVPIVTCAIEDNDTYALGARVCAIDALAIAAETLTQSEFPTVAQKTIHHQQRQQGRQLHAVESSPNGFDAGEYSVVDKVMLDAAASAPSRGANEDEYGDPSRITSSGLLERQYAEQMVSKNGSITRIKRPAKLALSKLGISTFRNNFGPVANLFFYPILRLIALTVRGRSYSLFGISATPVNTHQLSTAERGKSESNAAVGEDRDTGDNLDSLLLSRLLFALASFTRSSINTSHERFFALETMRVSLMCGSSISLSVRRASLSAALSSVRLWLHIVRDRNSHVSAAHSHPRMASGDAMSALCAITRNPFSTAVAIGGDDGAVNNANDASDVAELSMLVSLTADRCVKALKDDPDEHCRILKMEIARLAIEGLE